LFYLASAQLPSKQKDKGKTMSQEAVKQTEKAGTTISKDKLLEAIRRSPNKQFTCSHSPNSKQMTVVLTL
jgi:hypothetical protein